MKNHQQLFFRPNFRLENLYFDDSTASDDEFYVSNEEDNVEKVEDGVVVKVAINDNGSKKINEKEQDEIIDRLTTKQIEGLFRLLKDE